MGEKLRGNKYLGGFILLTSFAYSSSIDGKSQSLNFITWELRLSSEKKEEEEAKSKKPSKQQRRNKSVDMNIYTHQLRRG